LNLGNGVTDEHLATLPHSDRITSLSLEDAERTDAGLEYLLRLPHLRELNLSQTPMTAKGLETISSLRELRTLILGTARTTPKEIENGLACLSRLSKLQALDLRYVSLAGMDMGRMDIPTLRKLNVDTDRDRKEIRQVKERNPHLDPVTTRRITTRADAIRDSAFWSYDYLSNELEVKSDLRP